MSESGETAKQEAVKQLIIMLFGLLTIFFYMAMSSPDFFRTLQMRAARTLQGFTGKYAWKTGRISMESELNTGQQNYAAPYALARIRDAAKTWYEKAREGGR